MINKITIKEALKLFDVKKNIEIDEFLDMLVKTYLSYRKVRGVSESSLLQKLVEK